MAKTFDATLKALVDDHAGDWVNFLCRRLGLPSAPFELLDSDLSTTVQADRLFRLNGPKPSLLHLELESTGRLGIPEELLRYNVLAYISTKLPVSSFLFLLRPKATASDLTGELRLSVPDSKPEDRSDDEEVPYLTFRYTVVRVWQEPMDTFLGAGPGLAPLAILTNEASTDPEAAIERMSDQLREVRLPDSVKGGLFHSTLALGGMRYDEDQIEGMHRRLTMNIEKESVTFEWIMKRGEARQL